MFLGLEKLGRNASRSGRIIRRLLIVEDEPLVAFDTEHCLEHAGYIVTATVENYDHAVAAMDMGGIDLVITDIKLHGAGNGMDVARYAQEQGVPVLFVTGACPEDTQHLALGCLTKPYAQGDLLTALDIVDTLLMGLKLPKSPVGFQLFGTEERIKPRLQKS